MTTTPAIHPVSGDYYGEAYSSGYFRTLRFLASQGASQEAAEEIAQAAWAKGWEYRHQIRNLTSISAWVNSIAKNMLRSHIRRQRRMQALPESPAAPGRGTMAEIEAQCLLNSCRAADRHLLQKYYMEGYTASEIARETGLTSSAVRVRLLRIRRVWRPAALETLKGVFKHGNSIRSDSGAGNGDCGGSIRRR